MSYQPLSKEYITTIRETTSALVKLCSFPEEGRTIKIKNPRSNRNLSHYGTLRAIITPYMHYLEEGVIEALKNKDTRSVEVLREEQTKLMEAESNIPSRVPLS